MDVRNFAGGTTTRSDASNAGADPTSRVFSTSGTNGVDDPTGFTSSAGLVTQFTVPERYASSLELAVLGLLSTRCGVRAAAR